MDDAQHQELIAQLPAYALGALDDTERASLAAHLSTCPDCQQELLALQETVGLLALSLPAVQPSATVKATLFARLDDSPPADTASISTPAPTPLALPRIRHMAAVLGALAAVLIVGLIGWNLLMRTQLQREQRANRLQATEVAQLGLVNSLLNNPSAAIPVRGPATSDYGTSTAGYMYIDQAGSTALLLAYWLPHIEESQRFQVWLIKSDGQRDSGGLFQADNAGNAQLLINAPAPWKSYSGVGVSIEPKAGSTRPTGPSVCNGQFRQP